MCWKSSCFGMRPSTRNHRKFRPWFQPSFYSVASAARYYNSYIATSERKQHSFFLFHALRERQKCTSQSKFALSEYLYNTNEGGSRLASRKSSCIDFFLSLDLAWRLRLRYSERNSLIERKLSRSNHFEKSCRIISNITLKISPKWQIVKGCNTRCAERENSS